MDLVHPLECIQYAECLADRRRDGHQFLGELVEYVAWAGAEADPREEWPHAFDSAVEANSSTLPADRKITH